MEEYRQPMKNTYNINAKFNHQKEGNDQNSNYPQLSGFNSCPRITQNAPPKENNNDQSDIEGRNSQKSGATQGYDILIKNILNTAGTIENRTLNRERPFILKNNQSPLNIDHISSKQQITIKQATSLVLECGGRHLTE